MTSRLVSADDVTGEFVSPVVTDALDARIAAAAGSPDASYAVVAKSTGQSVGSGGVTALTWDVEQGDTDAYHSTSSNTDRLTVPTGLGGVFLVGLHIKYAQNATGGRTAIIQKNGSGIIDAAFVASSGTDTSVFVFVVIAAAAGDYFTGHAWQNSGSTLNTLDGVTGSTFSITRIGG
ncbi:MAG: hypothetical protein K0R60_1125 [Microbacterium sp.]|jgi:hypothetical protein|nr:hypothetical protein [Microbacterium sp.]